MDVIFFCFNLTSLGQLLVSPALGSSHIRPCLQSVVYMGLLCGLRKIYNKIQKAVMETKEKIIPLIIILFEFVWVFCVRLVLAFSVNVPFMVLYVMVV